MISMTVTPRAMNLVIGFAALLVGVAWTPQLEASSLYLAVSTDDSVVSLLQVSGKKKVGDNRTADAGASGASVSHANETDRSGLERSQNHVTSKVNDRPAVGRHPVTLLLESMAELHQMVKAKVEGLSPQVPTPEGMLFTACLVAGIMVMAVTLAMLYHGASPRRQLPSALGRTDAASIPGMDAPSASAGDVSAMSTAEVGGAGMRKPKPGCC
mmetsp:Transcript_50944/g.81314  ORF Transcript_50944/g.81314 Transcript_50944/m.81314 type:complete len:213 (-) Transcript_50944:48-686(-)